MNIKVLTMLSGAILLSGCFGGDGGDSHQNTQAVANTQPGARIVPADQVMSSGRHRNEVQAPNGAASVQASSENFSATTEVSVIR
ncbi:hypothetical protein ACRYJU_06990 [Alloalcanivorax xenomutans]|uniref:hypothetical protein n=1 Tax=Alloalcanivorax xenomutans TaxID=1094342 RepID=UPI00047BBDBC|nr:hypothetical protein [Alloalcanivorax xenomutans]SOC02476.1 hypothetical protein SAMN05877962_10575 [Alloalcanivorax xenomutans]